MTRLTIEADSYQLRYAVPSSVFRQSAFKWHPVDIGQCRASTQLWSLKTWPTVCGSTIFVVMSDSQLKAEYGAAYLTQLHIDQAPHTRDVKWVPVYDRKLTRLTGQFQPAKPFREVAEPTLLVVMNLGPEMTDTQVEATRDLVAAHSDIPIILCGSGFDFDPLKLAKLCFLPAHGYMHFNPTNETIHV